MSKQKKDKKAEVVVSGSSPARKTEKARRTMLHKNAHIKRGHAVMLQAKVRRQHTIDELKQKYGADVFSGLGNRLLHWTISRLRRYAYQHRVMS